jgi:site-specific recombinase XerD
VNDIKRKFPQFEDSLLNAGKSRTTILGYVADLRLFSIWFTQTNGETLTPQNLTPTDIREYRQYMLNVRLAKPTTINRHLSAIRAYCSWAKSAGLVPYNPIEGIKSVNQQSHAPKWLDKKEQAAIIREVERRVQAGKTESAKRQAMRDYAILIVLLNTGLRVGELVNLEISDISMSDRKGDLRVRSGKGTKKPSFKSSHRYMGFAIDLA